VKRAQAGFAVHLDRLLTSDRLHEGLELQPQGLSLGDREADCLAFGHCHRVPAGVNRRRNIGVLVMSQLLGEVVAHEHASLAEHAQLTDLGRSQPVDLQHSKDPALELEQRVEDVLVVGVNALLSLGVQALDIRPRKVMHDVEVMRR